MNVLVIGSGGREHALAWKLAQSASVSKVFCAPGNPGMRQIAECVDIPASAIDQLVEFAKEESIGLTVVGPEQPLSEGLSDAFQSNGLTVFGPTRRGAQLESSKHFAKEVMQAAGVPTAGYHLVNDRKAAEEYLSTHPAPIVLKADGLAAGKGVCVCLSDEEIPAALDHIFDALQADRVVIEEYLAGVEASFIVATDGKQVVPMASSHDYKRLLDGQLGPNTGGMGTVSPTPHLKPEQEAWVLENVMRPVMAELAKREIDFCGFLYAGLMISPAGEIKVLEFNVRMGDPECQSIMRRLDGDLFELLYGLASGDQSVAETWKCHWRAQSAVCVVSAAQGYPGSVVKGDLISGIDQAQQVSDVVVFHAGTDLKEGELVTNGGRVLGVTCLGDGLEQARLAAYKAVDMIQFKGQQVRRDIGH